MKRTILLAVVIAAAVAIWASAGCSLMNKGPAPAGHEMHDTGIESQISDY